MNRLINNETNCCSLGGLYLHVFCLIKQRVSQPHFDVVCTLFMSICCSVKHYNGPNVVKMPFKNERLDFI